MAPKDHSAGAPAVASPRPPSEKEKQRWLRKTKLCAYFARSGRCQNGADCAFAHSTEELQGAPDLYRTRMCPKLTAGSVCERTGCTFAHSEDELRPNHTALKRSLCKWFDQGACRNGDRCSYAHGEADLRTIAGKPPGLTAVVPRQFIGVAPLTRQGEPMKVLPNSSLCGWEEDGASECHEMQMKLPDPSAAAVLAIGTREEVLEKEVQDLRQAVRALSVQCSQIQQRPPNPQLHGGNVRTSLRKYRHAAPFQPSAPLAKDAAPFQPAGLSSSIASTDSGSGSGSVAGDSTPPMSTSELQDS